MCCKSSTNATRKLRRSVPLHPLMSLVVRSRGRAVAPRANAPRHSAQKGLRGSSGLESSKEVVALTRSLAKEGAATPSRRYLELLRHALQQLARGRPRPQTATQPLLGDGWRRSSQDRPPDPSERHLMVGRLAGWQMRAKPTTTATTGGRPSDWTTCSSPNPTMQGERALQARHVRATRLRRGERHLGGMVQESGSAVGQRAAPTRWAPEANAPRPPQ